jgi:hypothetical protein
MLPAPLLAWLSSKLFNLYRGSREELCAKSVRKRRVDSSPQVTTVVQDPQTNTHNDTTYVEHG